LYAFVDDDIPREFFYTFKKVVNNVLSRGSLVLQAFKHEYPELRLMSRMQNLVRAFYVALLEHIQFAVYRLNQF
jgi:hypothetical protein